MHGQQLLRGVEHGVAKPRCRGGGAPWEGVRVAHAPLPPGGTAQ